MSSMPLAVARRVCSTAEPSTLRREPVLCRRVERLPPDELRTLVGVLPGSASLALLADVR